MFKFRSVALPCVALLLAACGGGGTQETLSVSVDYAVTGASLFTATTLQPTLSGFNGHDPRCELQSGSPPPGMQVNGDCSISGRPTQAGPFSMVIKVGADRADGTINKAVTLSVAGPSLYYDNSVTVVQVGDLVSDAPHHFSSWTAPFDVGTLNWHYSVTAGSLPSGLVLDATSGVISGVVTTTGSYNATIEPVLSTAYGSFTLPSTLYVRTASAAPLR